MQAADTHTRLVNATTTSHYKGTHTDCCRPCLKSATNNAHGFTVSQTRGHANCSNTLTLFATWGSILLSAHMDPCCRSPVPSVRFAPLPQLYRLLKPTTSDSAALCWLLLLPCCCCLRAGPWLTSAKRSRCLSSWDTRSNGERPWQYKQYTEGKWSHGRQHMISDHMT